MSISPGPDGYSVSTDPLWLDLDLVHRYLSAASYWAKGIPRSVVEKSVRHALCFGVYKGDQQVGFARVVTDRATFAYLGDVFIIPEERGKGLSKWMMEHIHAHPDLQGLRRWMLFTRDAHGLYEQFGWTKAPPDACERMMQKHHPDVYVGS